MVQQALLDYVKQLLSQGYDSVTIRSTLSRAGYSQYDIDDAMRSAGAGTSKVSMKLLILIFVSVLVLIGIVLVLLRTTAPEEATLSLSLILFSTEVPPGSEVIVTADIANPSGTQTSGLIDYVVSGPSGKVASKTESFNVRTQTSVPTTISLLNDAQIGDYTITATLGYGKKSVTKSVQFSVKEEAQPTTEAPVQSISEKEAVASEESQKTCPISCDDLNFCTDDKCVDGRCVSVSKVPCCGNHVCESGEDASSCPIDCGENKLSPDKVKDEAKQIAKTDLTGAERLCDSLIQQTYVDYCLSDVSEASDRKDPCAKIGATEIRDACYIPFAYKNDPSVCSEITDDLLKQSCVSLVQVQKIQQENPA